METIISADQPGAGDPIKEATTASFQADVLEASKQAPVIVDFWAEWCGPCKQLTPMLESAVRQAGGAVRLVKIDVDKNQELAAQLRVQSVPTVFGFKDGRPVDGFAGAVPESQIKSFIQRLTGDRGPSAVDQALEQARAAYDSGDHAGAGNLYMQVLGQDQGNIAAIAGVIRCAVATGQFDQAREILSKLPVEILKNAEVEAAQTALELAEAGGLSAGETEALEIKLARDENDHQARYDLALALYGAGQVEQAIEHLLEIVSRDREWDDDAARKHLLKIFEALGAAHPATLSGRRRLSSMLFS